ncbi:MAG: histidinol-phosphatase HisJ family protein, partial [Promethearchaeota archaeon]
MTGRIDYHIHTKFCRHAVGEMEDYVQAAIVKDLDEIGFSDHFIMTYLPEAAVQEDYCMKKEELPVYIKNVKELQETQTNIVIKLGIEADYYEGKENEIKKLLNPFRFDYILGSVHVVNDRVIDDDRFRKKPQGHEIFELYRDYFNIIKKAIQSSLFDAIAHLDLPKKYGDRPQTSISELIDEVIETLSKKKVCVELNTGGY